jgi:hypothetical protein
MTDPAGDRAYRWPRRYLFAITLAVIAGMVVAAFVI